MRVASLGLCTDELVLLLARPGQLVSISFLAHDPLETPLAARAKNLHSNDGHLSSVIGLKPDLVVTGGAVNRFARDLAMRTGTPVIDVVPPTDLAGLRQNIRRVAASLGNAARGETLLSWMDAQLGMTPTEQRDAVMLVAGGLTPPPGSITAELLRYGGAAQMAFASDRLTLEGLAIAAPSLLIISDYRARQYSRPQAWLRVAGASARQKVVHLDGRLWTCPGPLVVADVARLRRRLRQ